MLRPDLPPGETALQVSRADISVVLAEDGARPLEMILPPSDDLAEIHQLRHGNASLQELEDQGALLRRPHFIQALASLEGKRARFDHSSTFHARIANLAAFAGRREEALTAWSKAQALSDSPIFFHKRVEALIALNRTDEAKSALEPAAATDGYSNLRLASFCVLRGDFQKANELVDRAVELDPLDFGARLFRGGLALVTQRYAEAIHHFRIAAESRDTSSAVYCNMGLAYARLGLTEKSFTALKRAIALDPFNVNAVIFLADLAFSERRSEEAIASLRLFVTYEQRNAHAWARLARSCLQLGLTDEAIAALKRQCSIRESTGAWNNLGVAYKAQGNVDRSLAAFKHALSVEGEKNSRDYYFAVRNLALFLYSNANVRDTSRFLSDAVPIDGPHAYLRDPVLSDIAIVRILATKKGDKPENAYALAWELINDESSANKLIIWIVSWLVAELSLNFRDFERASFLVERYESEVDHLSEGDKLRRSNFFNNAAFAFAENDQLDRAERYLSHISNAIHKEPYPTATLGLIHFRRGHVDRATALYEEAAQLAPTASDKVRIRQKFNLELGKSLLTIDRARAVRTLKRVVDAKGGEPSLVRMANTFLRTLPVGRSDDRSGGKQ